MRILHIVSSLNVGGAERFVIDMATEQKHVVDLQPSILTMGLVGEPLENEVNQLGIPLFRATAIRSLRNITRDFDIIHIHSSHCLLRVLIANIRLNTKIIYTRHNESVHTSIKWKLTYLIARFRLHKMIFVADKAKDNYLKRYPSFKPIVKTILNGVFPTNRQKLKSNYFRISHVGRFVPLKSQHVLIEAIATLPEELQSVISVSFFGTGDLLEKNRLLAKKIIPSVEVNFKGIVTNRDDIYMNTDILVVTSVTEGLSLAILESLSSGTPVIASNVGGNPELVKNDVNGLLYDYGDSSALAEHISFILNDTEAYSRYSEQSVQAYELNFSMRKCVALYSQSYE